MKRFLIVASAALALAGCNDRFASSSRSIAPIPARTMALMSEKGMSQSDPILVRLYKKESELEVWKKAQDGKYALLKSFPICRWSGQLGPKQREGDRQAPEGFYNITPGQMNPNSAYYLSFNTGYPNAYDRALNRTGSELMVHGTCSSRGCYAMTDEGIAEVYAIARESFAGGQKAFQFQAYPFRMTAQNLAKFRRDPNMPFWANLKEGADHFEITKREPKVAVCNGRYAFDTVGSGCAPDPTLAPAVAEKEADDRQAVAELVAKGIPAVKTVYADGGGHESFRQASIGTAVSSDTQYAFGDTPSRASLGDVSRPDALAEGPREIAWEDHKSASQKSATLVVSATRQAPANKLAAVVKAETGLPDPRPLDRHTVVASADPEQPLPVARAVDKPFYERMMASVSGRGQPVEVPAPSSVEPIPASAATVSPPVKPAGPATHKGAARGEVKKVDAAKVDAAKVDAAKAEAKPHGVKQSRTAPARGEPGQKHADGSGVIPGSAPVGPLATSFRAN